MTKSEFKSLFFFAVAVCAGIVFCAVVFLTYAGKFIQRICKMYMYSLVCVRFRLCNSEV